MLMKTLFKILIPAAILLLSCQEKEKDPVVQEQLAEQHFKNEDPPEIMQLKPEYEAEAKQWEALYNLENGIQKFQRTTEIEYALGVEELLELEKTLSTSGYPEKFDVPSIKSRVLVLKTHLLQTQSIVNKEVVNDTLIVQHIKIITAFNAIKKQVAETLTNDITEELLKDIEQEEFLKDLEKQQ